MCVRNRETESTRKAIGFRIKSRRANMKRQNRKSSFTATYLNRRTGLLLVSAAAMALSGSRTKAATLDWDPLFSDSSLGGGPGTWNLNSTSNWFNGTTDVQWTDSSPNGTDV